MKNKTILLLFLIGTFLFAANFGELKRLSFFKKNEAEKEPIFSKSDSLALEKIENKTSKLFTADIKEGIIGVKNADDIDDAYDNVFHLKIDELPKANENVYLEYELFGYDQAASISRSLNNQPSIGGQFISENKAWSKQSELLSEKSLRAGDNVLLFTAPEGISNTYKIRNVQIVYKNAFDKNTLTLLKSENKLYIKGTNFPSQIKKMTIAGIAIDMKQPEFELVLDAQNIGKSISITKETTTGIASSEKIELNQFLQVDNYRPIENAKERIFAAIHVDKVNTVAYKDFNAVFPVGSLKKNINVSVSGLRKIDIAPLNAAMVNVTDENAGFRLLPHGTIFEKAVTLSLPYNKKAIPEGYTEKDINVFYFDENKRLWQEVSKDSLDIKKGIIKAKTTHFTDFIAGIIKMPESPETSGYTPTSIKDLKAATPLVGIQSIPAPAVNGKGTASTSFSIVIPNGRGGMQPSFNLQYDSDGGHSWTGLGWDLSAPSVNIETRWGAPRYDASNETESYTIGGDALIPNSHRAEWIGRTSDKQFYPRRESTFQQIIRKGSSPKNYYWVVRDKNGAASYYGGTTAGLSTNGILQDANGNIGHWALCLQVDLKGNTVEYEYDKIDGELYLKKVYYTGSESQKGNYSVTFVKNGDLGEANRSDVQVSARLGFKQLNNQLLRKIEVRYKDDMIRSYELQYKEGAFKKTLLESISEYDSESKLFYTNKLDYFDDVRDASGKYNPFGPAQTWDVPSDNIKEGFTGIKDFESNNTLVGSTSGTNTSVNYRLGIGLPTLGTFKNNTIGAHGANGSGKSETAIVLEDLDGDSYPDKVFKIGNDIYYRKNLHATQPNTFGEATKIVGIKNLGTYKNKSFSWGVDASVGYGAASANVGYDEQRSTNRTLSYFMDFNGDGLVDFVNNGQVYYNRIVNGVPEFLTSSLQTPAPVSGGGDLTLEKPDRTQELQELLAKNPLHDVVRVWQAPVKGTIIVNQSYQLIEDTSDERQEYKTRNGQDKADGVHLYFQKGNTLLWDEVIGAVDYSLKNKAAQTINVEKGERLYFRISSIKDGNFDKVIWDPKIEYTQVEKRTLISNSLENISTAAKDANLISLQNFHASADFFASQANSIIVPKAGTISFAGKFTKPVTPDHVTLKIVKNVINVAGTTTLFEKKFLASDIVDFDLQSLVFSIPDDNTFITTTLESSTNIDPKLLFANPTLTLPALPNSQPGDNIHKVDIGHSFYSKIDGNYVIEGIKPAVSGKLNLFINPANYSLTNPAAGSQYNGNIIITAKQNGLLVGRVTYAVTNGVLSLTTSAFDLTYSYAQAQKDIPLDLEIYVSDPILNEIVTAYPKTNALKVNYQIADLITDPTNPVVWAQDTDDFSIFINLSETENNFGLQYKNWGRFIVNGDLAGNLIDQSKLKFENNSGIDPNNFPDPNTLDPDNMPGEFDTGKEYFLPMSAVYSDNILYGGEKASFIQKEFMGTNRLGEDDFAEYTDFTSPIAGSLGNGETEALDMISESKSRSIGGGVGVGGAGGGISGGLTKSNGDTFVVQTMSDLNGDRYPDYIIDNKVQYTSPIGGKSTEITDIGDFSHSKTSSTGGSLSGSYNHGSPQSSLQMTVNKGKVKFSSGASASIQEALKAGGTISLGGNVGKGEDHSTYIYSDINGDGLADRIETNEMVSLNTGYGFLPAEKWEKMNEINKGTSLDIGGSAGFSVMNGSFSGGLNYSRSTSDNSHSFLDINGDGLADKIQYKDNEVSVELNTGNSFAEAVSYPRYEKMARNTGVSYGGSLGVSYDIPLVPPFIIMKLTPSFGGSFGASTSRSEASFSDIDGDGNLDYILSTDQDNLIVRLSNIKRTNKLKGVTNGAGNSYVVDYELLQPSYERPSAKWVLQSVDVFDGYIGDGIDHSITKFKYEDGFHDRREREFYGFGKVIQEQIDAADNSVFMTTVQEFYNQDYFRKNLLKHSYSLDKNGKMRQETENEYSFVDVATQASISVSDLNLASCDDKHIFVGLIHTNEKVYEGGSDYLEKNIFNTYDAKGNIIQYEDLGNGSTSDKITAKISYHESTTPYYDGIPKQLEVFTEDGLRRKRTTTINTTTAEVTQIKNYASVDKIAITDIEYDTYGNLQKITGPANHKDQRMTLEYVYDTENHQYMTEIKDAFGYQNKMEYSYRFGMQTKNTDRNDQSTDYTFDAKGRIATIRAPYEIASGKPYTIAYEYFPEAKVPYAKTRNYDPELDKDIETYTYADGLDRSLQIKKTASLFTQAGSADQEAHIITGKVIYDGLGRAITNYYPTTTTTLDDNFSTAISTVTPTKTEYDEVNRPVKVTLPDGSTNTTVYTLDNYDGLTVLKTVHTDALNQTNTTYTDAAGQNVASMQNDLTTKFDTNALGEMIKVTDAMDHVTQSSYDWLGRRIEFTHPDAGTTKMEYDLAGNMTTRITQDIKNIVPNGGAIQYVYNYNRLESIKYPKNPQNNVQYNYGKADGTASRRGRLWFVQDASGGQEFFFGKLGEIEKEIRTLRITPTDIQTYISQYEYDTWNRIQKMTYPDGEVVEYTYNRAGNLQSMQGKKESHTYDYIKQLSYDEFEQRKYLKYGNDTETNYTYDPVMRRLQQLQVQSGSRQVMNNAYGYDLVGNILSIKNTAPIINNTLGGNSSHEYQYDDFYRLKSAKASYQGEFTKANYELNMSYNKMHNITKKELVHIVNNEQKGYALEYNYDNELHPNAPNKIVEAGKTEPRQYTYDGNGNPTSYTEDKSFRKMTWDEENRLMGINDNGRIHQFTYDANGERIIKSSGDSQHVAINGETAATIVHTDDYTGYVSPYFVISKGKFTKHYFEGTGRIVSKLGNGTFAQPLKLTAGGVNYGKLSAEQQKALDTYVKSLGVPPGPPTQQGIYATPEFTGDPYPSEAIKSVEENQEPPAGWPRNPIFNAPGDVPGPPVQFGPPVEPETVKSGEGFTGIGMPENDIFYFHPDHLGSTSYITTKNGSISQHVEYIAFGEILFEEHTSNFSSPYLFNGKELDRETNLSYYGARYLDMKTSLWLTVDPLAEKHPNIGAYVYCVNNPIILKDPDGRDPITAAVEGLTAFGIEAGLDFMTNLIVKGESGDKAFNNINWKGATYEGVKATAISVFLPTGSQTAARIARISRSKIGKLTMSFVANLTSEAMKNVVSGKYNDKAGDFSFDLMMADFQNVAVTAAISTLLDAGMGGKAEEMYEKFAKSNAKLAKQYEKLARNLRSPGSTQQTISNRVKKIDEAAIELMKNGGKATLAKTGEETVKKAADEGQKKLRGVE